MRHLPSMRRNYQGFTLMEMAVVLMIIGTLMGGVLVAVTKTTENGRRANALAQLRVIEQALYGFAQTTGRLPCPASESSNGLAAQAVNGSCDAWKGFVPAATLSLSGSVNSDGLLLDPWQNPYRYIVSNLVDAANEYVWVEKTDLQDFYNANLTIASANMLRVCSNASCNPSEINSDTIPALVLTMGANWATCTSANEIENSCEVTNGTYALPDDNDFVLTEYSEDNFDDQLRWLSPYLLFDKLIHAGKLP